MRVICLASVAVLILISQVQSTLGFDPFFHWDFGFNHHRKGLLMDSNISASVDNDYPPADVYPPAEVHAAEANITLSLDKSGNITLDTNGCGKVVLKDLIHFFYSEVESGVLRDLYIQVLADRADKALNQILIELNGSGAVALYNEDSAVLPPSNVSRPGNITIFRDSKGKLALNTNGCGTIEVMTLANRYYSIATSSSVDRAALLAAIKSADGSVITAIGTLGHQNLHRVLKNTAEELRNQKQRTLNDNGQRYYNGYVPSTDSPPPPPPPGLNVSIVKDAYDDLILQTNGCGSVRVEDLFDEWYNSAVMSNETKEYIRQQVHVAKGAVYNIKKAVNASATYDEDPPRLDGPVSGPGKNSSKADIEVREGPNGVLELVAEGCGSTPLMELITSYYNRTHSFIEDTSKLKKELYDIHAVLLEIGDKLKDPALIKDLIETISNSASDKVETHVDYHSYINNISKW